MMEFDQQILDQLAAEFDFLGHEMRRKNPGRGGSEKTADRRFQAWFGTPAIVMAKCWVLLLLDPDFDKSTKSKKWLLWALILLKEYTDEHAMAASAGGVDEKTFRLHAWEYVFLLADLESLVVRPNVFSLLTILYLLTLFTLLSYR